MHRVVEADKTTLGRMAIVLISLDLQIRSSSFWIGIRKCRQNAQQIRVTGIALSGEDFSI